MDILNILQKYKIKYKIKEDYNHDYYMINAFYCINKKMYIYENMFKNLKLIAELNNLKSKVLITCFKSLHLNMIPKNIIFAGTCIIISIYNFDNIQLKIESFSLVNDNIINFLKTCDVENVHIDCPMYDNISQIISTIKTNKLQCTFYDLYKFNKFGEINLLKLSKSHNYNYAETMNIINKINDMDISRLCFSYPEEQYLSKFLKHVTIENIKIKLKLNYHHHNINSINNLNFNDKTKFVKFKIIEFVNQEYLKLLINIIKKYPNISFQLNSSQIDILDKENIDIIYNLLELDQVKYINLYDCYYQHISDVTCTLFVDDILKLFDTGKFNFNTKNIYYLNFCKKYKTLQNILKNK